MTLRQPDPSRRRRIEAGAASTAPTEVESLRDRRCDKLLANRLAQPAGS